MNPEEVAASIQNFAICIEMALAAVAHHYFFSYRDWYREDPLERTPRLAMLEAMAEFDAAHEGWDARAGGGAVGEAATSVAVARAVVAASAAKAAARAKAAAAEAAEEEEGGGGGARSASAPPSAGRGARASARAPARSPGAAGAAADDAAAAADPAAAAVPAAYGTALMGMLPFDVIKDTGTLVSGGFGLAHKWDKRAQKERAAVHEMATVGWEVAGRHSAAAMEAGGGGSGVGAGATPRGQGSEGGSGGGGGGAPVHALRLATPATGSKRHFGRFAGAAATAGEEAPS
jgi:hypothetical protein